MQRSSTSIKGEPGRALLWAYRWGYFHIQIICVMHHLDPCIHHVGKLVENGRISRRDTIHKKSTDWGIS
jgi:hypothetical protein